MEREGRSLEVTPTWSVATLTTFMVFVCLFVERSIFRFGEWLKKTNRKALSASLEKIKEELMLLGIISLLLGQWSKWISQICVNSSLFTSKFYICSEEDYEPFVSAEGLEQLNRFLFVLGITHVLYSCVVVGLSMSKIYSWRKWEIQAGQVAEANAQAQNKVMRRQSTFALHRASHPWSRNRVLIWMLCFLRQFRSSVQKSDYMALRLGFITNHRLPQSYDFHKYMVRGMEDEFYKIVGISCPLWAYAILCIFMNIHGLNIYFWLSFIPAILVMIVGTKLQHVVSLLALEIAEPREASIANQVKPRDELFWFGKPEVLLRLIQFISFQNAFEMATFMWTLWGFKERSCFTKNHAMIIIRLVTGVLVQFWCGCCTVPLNVIITTMGSRFNKALIAESVRMSLHSWCKRVRERSRTLNSIATRSIDEIDTAASGTVSPCSSPGSTRARVINNVVSELQV
ncbi:MLO-like protein 4-like [Dorcoceras hygrometricum]|uniref:MLO-like protein n=1 Tax=Dorcoceras hygrometricum TaxID=472368 RepID=A0A2Z7ALL2_9LAMI|nr:MLO-like protein 4-like [Dorcoceras hygrometricum]